MGMCETLKNSASNHLPGRLHFHLIMKARLFTKTLFLLRLPRWNGSLDGLLLISHHPVLSINLPTHMITWKRLTLQKNISGEGWHPKIFRVIENFWQETC